MRRFVQALSTRSVSPWEHGAVNGRPARRHILTGECQFVLWKAGKQGHTEDYWHRFGAGHEKHFRLNVEHIHPLPAGAEVDHGVEVQATENHGKETAGRGLDGAAC
jgi:hypothetical protein